MKNIVLASRPGSVLAGMSIDQLERELVSQGAGVQKLNINKLPAKIDGDLIVLYNCSYRVHKNKFKRIEVPIFNVPAAYGKHRQYKILESAGVPIPKYKVIDKNSDLDKVIKELKIPLVTKPVIGTGGTGVVLHMNERDLRRSLSYTKVIAQRYVKEAVAGDVRALVIAGKVVGALWRTPKSGRVASNFHAGGRPSIYNITEEEKEAAVSAAAAMGLTISGVDLVPTTKGPLILEANSVPDLMHFKEVAGVNAIPAYAKAIIESA